MQIGIIGLGRMGADMARRLLRSRHDCVVYDIHADAVQALTREGAVGATGLADLIGKLLPPRVVWLMAPAARVDPLLNDLLPLLARDDVIVDGGNSHFHDDIRRAADLAKAGLHYVDVGTSGGVWGKARGYCLMIGGEPDIVQRLDPLFQALAPGIDAAPRTAGRAPVTATAERGYLHCGPHGAGHFVKMVHNGIEYGLMAAYAEGLNILHGAGAGLREGIVDAETTPLRHPEYYRYDFKLADVAEVWRRGSVIASWLLDLTAAALVEDPDLAKFAGRVSDSGEGRWTVQAAIDQGVPAPVISAALYARFSSRGRIKSRRSGASSIRCLATRPKSTNIRSTAGGRTKPIACSPATTGGSTRPRRARHEQRGATMNPTRKLHDIGQRLWLDTITRGLLDRRALGRYIDQLAITELTSNPTIFARRSGATTPTTNPYARCSPAVGLARR